jgi:hypothetical protein
MRIILGLGFKVEVVKVGPILSASSKLAGALYTYWMVVCKGIRNDDSLLNLYETCNPKGLRCKPDIQNRLLEKTRDQ